MKLEFGNNLQRFFGGGVKLWSIEKILLVKFFEYLPDGIRRTVEKQIDQYNLVQREINGRAVNFYCKKFLNSGAKIPLLTTKVVETKLLSIQFKIPDEKNDLNANFWLVNGRFFSINFSHDMRPFKKVEKVNILDVKNSWRSNVILSEGV